MALGDNQERELVLKIIHSRTSVRKYRQDDVSDEDLAMLFEAARWAPSGENAQPWRFIVVRDPEVRQKIGIISRKASGRRFTAEFVSEKMQERLSAITDPAKKAHVFSTLISGQVSGFLGEAPVLIVVCGYRDCWDVPFDTSAAIENMLLMATAMNLGACWVCATIADVRDEEKIIRLFNVPKEYKIFAIVGLGHPDRPPKPRPRKPLDQLVFRERFGVPFFAGDAKQENAT